MSDFNSLISEKLQLLTEIQNLMAAIDHARKTGKPVSQLESRLSKHRSQIRRIDMFLIDLQKKVG